MRKFRVLNKNYEDIGLFTPISALNGYSLYDVYYLEVAVPFLSSEQYDYWEDVYEYLKNGTKKEGFNFDRVLPSVYLPIEPVGFGNRYKFKELNNKTYDHELDFENMELSMLFGVYSNAYTSYKAMQEFVKNNELVIEYDYGIGKRYTDVRLINAPKTEKETSKLIISRFSFKRLTPFYELLDESDLPITNDTGLDMGIILKYSDYNENVWFNFTIDGVINRVYLSNPQSLNFELYDSLDKKMIFNGENVGYGMIDWTTTDEPFIVIKPNQVLENVDVGDGSGHKVIIKKWVSD